MPNEKLAVVTIPHVSGFAEDAVVNTLAIRTDPGWTIADGTLSIVDPIENFYNNPNVPADQLSDYLSLGLSRAALAVSVKIYNVAAALDGTPHGSPIAEDHFTLGAPPNYPAMPEEVALALTLRAEDWAVQPVEQPDNLDGDLVPQRPRSRYTGKVFVGPFNNQAATEDAAKKARPVTSLMTAMLNGAELMKDELEAAGHSWCVWSRKDATFRAITHVQVDNAWDTQRRRGVDPTVRTTRTVEP